MSDKWRMRLRAAIKDKGLTGESLAERMGAHPVTVSKLLNGRMKLNEQWLHRFASALDTGVTELLTGTEPLRQPAATAGSIPVYGFAAGAFAGAFTITTEEVERVAAPPGLAQVRDAYALIVSGTSMEPRYFAGDVIFINPHRPPRPGDHVVIQILNHHPEGRQTFVKRYMGETGEDVVVTQYNPPINTAWKRRDVAFVHRVLTTNEALGV